MHTEKKPEEKLDEKPKKTLLGAFLTREKPDQEYLPDLKNQWVSMDKGERVKFILGGVIGLIIFIGALILVYLIISAMRS